MTCDFSGTHSLKTCPMPRGLSRWTLTLSGSTTPKERQCLGRLRKKSLYWTWLTALYWTWLTARRHQNCCRIYFSICKLCSSRSQTWLHVGPGTKSATQKWTPHHKIVCGKPSTAPHHSRLNQALVFPRNSARKPILRNKRKNKSGLAQESQQYTTAQTQRPLPPPSSEVALRSSNSQSRFTLRPSPVCRVATWTMPELLGVLDLRHPASLSRIWSLVCRAGKTLSNSIMMWSGSRPWNGSAVADGCKGFCWEL